MAKVSLVTDEEYGDWQALYINGQLVDEAHTLQARDILQAIEGLTIESVELFSIESFPTGRGEPCLNDYTNFIV